MKTTLALVIATFGTVVPLQAQLKVYDLEANHSTIGFAVPIFGGMGRVTGKFTDVAASIHYDPADLSTASVEVSIAVDSIATGIAARDADLQSFTWFNSPEHPEILFFSDRIRQTDSGLVASGDFTMRGVTKTIDVPFSLRTHRFEDGKQILGVSIRLSLNRQEFGVGATFEHTSLENFVADEIGIEIDLWTRAGKSPEPEVAPQPPLVRF